jgi:signal transduction histidine kinase/DNA-binding NarL/FixJ family response regulator
LEIDAEKIEYDMMTTVLFVDSQPEFLDKAKKFMKKVGIDATTSSSAQEALGELRDHEFDVIISGLEPGGKDGIILLKSFKKMGIKTPFILYADKGIDDMTIKAMRSGAEMVLQKGEDTKAGLRELAAIIDEIAKRKDIENALRKREKDFRTIVNNNADAMIVLDQYGVIQYLNPAATTLFNLPEPEMLGKMMGFPIVLDEPVEMYVLRGFKEFVATEMRMVEVEWADKPSYLISFRDVTGHVRYEEELENRVEERTDELLKANKKLQGEIEDRKAMEEELRVEIEERETAEEELKVEIDEREKADAALKDAKAQADLYLDLMGHDINNLNQIGIGYLELAMESSDLEEIRSLIEKPLEVLRNSSEIIQNVRRLQQLTKEETKKDMAASIINMCDVMSDLITGYSSQKSRDIKIHVDAPKLCFVKANNLIKDVFSNIIDNSIKHSDPAKPLAINIIIKPTKESKKDYFLCVVEDNGPGIQDWVKDKIFMRFQRGATKAHGKGLGLYLVKRLVEDYKGKVWVEDRVPGEYMKGTRFVVMLPAAIK